MFSFVPNEFEQVVALSEPSPTKLSKREQEKDRLWPPPMFRVKMKLI